MYQLLFICFSVPIFILASASIPRSVTRVGAFAWFVHAYKCLQMDVGLLVDETLKKTRIHHTYHIQFYTLFDTLKQTLFASYR